MKDTVSVIIIKLEGSDYMNERERLLAILYAMPEAMNLSEMADYLLEHGITVPPTEMDGEYAEKKTIERRAIIEELNRIGGCDASDEWSKGWDAAIDKAIKISETAPTAKTPKCAFCEQYQIIENQTKEFHDKICNKFMVDYSVTLKGAIYSGRSFIGNMDLISSRLNYCPICGKLIKEGKNNDS